MNQHPAQELAPKTVPSSRQTVLTSNGTSFRVAPFPSIGSQCWSTNPGLWSLTPSEQGNAQLQKTQGRASEIPRLRFGLVW
jgi:hypothetical protein